MSLVNSCVVDMDVDGPVSGSGTLKRCSSAPMINETNSIMTTTTPSGSTNRDQQNFNIFGTAAQTRTRRFSASFSPVPGSPVSGLRLTPRINQLRQEDFADISNQRELAHEREIHHTMQISQSWEDLSLMNESHNDTKPNNNNNNNNNNNKMGPLHVNLPTYGGFMCNSPSPTRLTSPGFQSPTRTSRTFIRRSASPVLRPSPLGVKRKLDDDCSKTNEFHMSPRAKRFHSYSSTTGGIIDRGGLLTTTITTSTTTSISLPGSLSSVGTPESLSSADSPSSFNFRNVDSPSPNRTMPSEPMILSKNDHDMNESPS